MAVKNDVTYKILTHRNLIRTLSNASKAHLVTVNTKVN